MLANKMFVIRIFTWMQFHFYDYIELFYYLFSYLLKKKHGKYFLFLNIEGKFNISKWLIYHKMQFICITYSEQYRLCMIKNVDVININVNACMRKNQRTWYTFLIELSFEIICFHYSKFWIYCAHRKLCNWLHWSNLIENCNQLGLKPSCYNYQVLILNA